MPGITKQEAKLYGSQEAVLFFVRETVNCPSGGNFVFYILV
jgi:hypothetical protein